MTLEGEINVVFLDGDKVKRTSISKSVGGDKTNFQSRDLVSRTSVSVSFVPAIEDGTTTYTFKDTDPGFGCAFGGSLIPIAGTVVVESTNSTKNLKLTFSGKVSDEFTPWDIKGTASLNVSYPR